MPSAKREAQKGSLAALIKESTSLARRAVVAVERLDQSTRQQGSKAADELVDTSADAAGAGITRQQTEQPDKKPNNTATRQPGGQHVISFEASTSHLKVSPFNPRTELPPLDMSRKPIELTTNQFRVLHYIYFTRPYSVASRGGKSQMQLHLGLAYGTLRGNIQALNRKGYVEKPYQVNIGNLKGQTCRVNIEFCLPLFGPSGIEEPKEKVFQHHSQSTTDNLKDRHETGQQTEQPDNQTTRQPTEQQDPSIEDSLIYKNLTTNRAFFLSYFEGDPSLKYWIDRGLHQKNLSAWATLCNCDIPVLLRYMDYCRFEMVDLGREEKNTDTLSPIESVPNYFYKTIKRLGHYRKPNGYISIKQKQAAKTAMVLDELKKEADKLEQISSDIWHQQRETEFLSIFNDPESDMYKKCYAALNDFQKGRARKNYNSFKNFMFQKYLELIDEKNTEGVG